MVNDVTPELLDKIQKSFEKQYKSSSVIKNVLKKVEDNEATYNDAFRYSNEVGNIRAKVFKNILSSSVLPNGKMYFNIADKIIRETLGNDYKLIANVATSAMKTSNKNAGISLKAQKAKVDEDKLKGFIDRLSSEDNYDDVAWILDEPVKTFSRSAVDDTTKQNAEFQDSVGGSGVVIRISEGNCCAWCEELEGEYPIPAPSEVYQRHDNCKCTVEYKGVKLSSYTGSNGKANTFR